MNIQKLSNPNGFIEIAAFDHRDSLQKMLSPDLISPFKNLCAQTFAGDVASILVDPEYGKDAIKTAKNENLGVILSREISGYENAEGGRETKLYDEYNAAKLKLMGADAVKLLVYYNPEAPNHAAQLEIVEQVSDETLQEDLPMLLEIITYPVEGKTYDKAKAIIEAASEMSNYADILKLEFPIDVKTEQDITNATEYLKQMTKTCQDKPWILLSRGLQFDLFKKALEVSKANGCKGFAVGRAVWQEIAELKTFPEIEEFMKTTGKSRMHELSQIF